MPRVHECIHVSSWCHLNFALHAAVDGLSEAELAYSTKATRDGLRVIDMYYECFERKLRLLADGCRKRYGGVLNTQ